MNARNLNKRSATDWARVDQMTDEEIDTSEIPPLDDAFFASAKWQLPRLYISLNDLRDARRFADYILKRGLHDKKTELRKLEHLAFNTSLIVSYSRPFKSSHNFKGQGKSSLDGCEDKVLAEEELELHRRILTLRDQAYTPSDPRSDLFDGFDYFRYVELFRTIEVLDKSTTLQLTLIIGKWVSYLEAEKSKLKKSLTRLTRPRSR